MPPLSTRGVLTEMLAAYRERWPFLLGTGLLVFVPVGLIEAFDNPLEDADLGGLDAVTALEFGALVAAQSVAPVIATVLYAGIVSAAVAARREGTRPSLPRLARTLPYGRLVGADLLLALVVAAGVLMLIVPGLVLLTWFALVAPRSRSSIGASWTRFAAAGDWCDNTSGRSLRSCSPPSWSRSWSRARRSRDRSGRWGTPSSAGGRDSSSGTCWPRRSLPWRW